VILAFIPIGTALYLLKRGDNTYVHVDYRQMGLGGDDSWSSRVRNDGNG